MNAFRFPLQKALDLRQFQLHLEEAKFERATANLAAVDRERDALRAARATAEHQVRAAAVLGRDLTALDAFRRRAHIEEGRIAARRGQCEAIREERRRATLEARRKLRLLERLKERRQAEWNAAAAKELEEIASESYSSQWVRDWNRQAR